MPKSGEQVSAGDQNIWSTADFAFALRELREEFPQQPTEAITAAIRTAEQTLPASSGRVRLVQLARAQIRAR